MDEIQSFGGQIAYAQDLGQSDNAAEPSREAIPDESLSAAKEYMPRDPIAVGPVARACSHGITAGGDQFGEGHRAYADSLCRHSLSDPIVPGQCGHAYGCGAGGALILDGGQLCPGAHHAHAAVQDLPEEITALCREAVDAHRQGMFMQKQRTAMQNRTLAFLRVHYLGWNLSLPGAERDRLTKEAARLVKLARAGQGEPDIVALVATADQATAVCEQYEVRLGKRLEKIAKNLPGALFVARVAGFGFLSFGRIVGEAGPLSNYPTHSHLWKRMGLAVINGERQRRIADKELAVLHGYSPKRRSVSWVAFDSCMKHQVRKGGVAVGPYGEHYLRKKAEYTARGEAGEWPAKALKLRIDRMARRYAEKRLIRDLREAWRRELRLMAP